MLTTLFLVAGVVSFLVAGIVALWRLVIQGHSVGDLPRWEPLLGIANAILAMAFFSLGIYRSLEGPTSGTAAEPSPTVIASPTEAAPPGATVIIVPFFPTPDPAATPPPTAAEPAPTSPTSPTPTATRIAPAVDITAPRGGAVVTTRGVRGTSQGVAPGQAPDSPPPWVYLLVRRTDAESGVGWYVQAYPVVDPDGSWEGFLSEGLADIASGTPFDICAIVTDDLLPTGEHVETPQAFSRDCVAVEAS